MVLKGALDAKEAADGVRYSQRELARDSDTDWSYISKMIAGKRRPSAAMIEAWAKALDPYLDLDRALLAAGHAPKDAKSIEAWQAISDELVGEHNTQQNLSRLASLTDSAVAYGIPVRESAHAGEGGVTDPLAYESPLLLDGRHVALTVRGSCMEPDVYPGEVVIGKLDERPADGGLVIADIDGRADVRLYDARRRRLLARDGSPAISLRHAGAVIPVIAIQRPVRPKQRRPGGGTKQ